MGIGPQNLGASGMNPKSTPCGHSKSPLTKISSSLDGKGASPLQKSGFNIAAIEAKQEGKTSFNYGGKEFPVK